MFLVALLILIITLFVTQRLQRIHHSGSFQSGPFLTNVFTNQHQRYSRWVPKFGSQCWDAICFNKHNKGMEDDVLPHWATLGVSSGIVHASFSCSCKKKKKWWDIMVKTVGHSRKQHENLLLRYIYWCRRANNLINELCSIFISVKKAWGRWYLQ